MLDGMRAALVIHRRLEVRVAGGSCTGTDGIREGLLPRAFLAATLGSGQFRLVPRLDSQVVERLREIVASCLVAQAVVVGVFHCTLEVEVYQRLAVGVLGDIG